MDGKNLHAAQVRRQKELLRSIGVPDLSPEEITERVRPLADDDLMARLGWL